MIPSYLNGTLSDAERQEVDNYAAQNPDVAADIEFQRNLMSAVKETGNDESIGEFGWARLSKAINQDGSDERSTPLVANDQDSNVNAAQPLKFWRIAAAALAVISLGQAGVIATKSGTQDDTARYVTVSDSSFIGVDIAFRDDASQMHVTELLQDVNGELVSGPSALGFYKVKFESKDLCMQAVKAFNAANKVIETSSSCK